MIKISIHRNILQYADSALIRKNIIPMTFCFGIWAITCLFLFNNVESLNATAITFLLVTFQLISSINDIYNRTIPLKLMIIALVLGLLILGVFYKSNFLVNSIIGGTVAFGVMGLLILISKKQVGGGDLALMTVTGFFVGIHAFFSVLFVSIVLTGIYSMILVLIKKGNRKTEIPFAPFILLATVILVLSGINSL